MIAATPSPGFQIGRLPFSALFAAALCLNSDAALPAVGTVVEGSSVPSVSLGFTRAQVMAAYGEPSFCQGPAQSFCTYNLSGLGSVNMRYEGPDGGDASGTSDDVLHHVSWSAFNGWVTTAGISTDLARNDPNAMVEAYPAGIITTNAQGGIYSMRDASRGIQAVWSFNPYSGITTVSLSIFEGTTATTPVPTLAIEQTGADSITLSWTGGEEFAVQSRTDLQSGSWQPVAGTAVSEGGRNSLTLPLTGGARFFRLAR